MGCAYLGEIYGGSLPFLAEMATNKQFANIICKYYRNYKSNKSNMGF
jgi:hypothetical protein